MADDRNLGAEFRGLGKLLVQATKDTTTVIENMHRQIAGGPALVGRPLKPIVDGPLKVVYGTIRGVTDAVGWGIDSILTQLEPALTTLTLPAEYDIVVAALNGVVGDYLADQDNPLAIKMALVDGNADLLQFARSDAKSRVLICVHGSAMDDRQITRRGHNHTISLAEKLSMTPIFLRYNSGRHISDNGEEFSRLLNDIVENWPTAIEQLVLFGFSMGGLVCRSAAAQSVGEPWFEKLSAMIFLGTPHQGAPLERYGNLFENLLDVSDYSRPLRQLSRLRSAGVTDLRYGNILASDWKGRDRFELFEDCRQPCKLPDIPCFAIAGTTRDDATGSDGLVPVESALGRHKLPSRDLGIAENHTWIELSTAHLDLLASQTVFAQMLTWLQQLFLAAASR